MAIVERLLLQDTSTGIILGFVVLLVVVYFLSFSSIFKEQTNEPPGPKPLPFFGNLLQLDIDRPHESLCKLAKTYGPVFKVYLGPNKVVVLAGYKTVKQALVNYADEFGEREIVQIFKNLHEEHGILFSNGENWKEMRRFALTNLRDFGMGKRGSEDKIIEEIQYLKEVFRSFGGQPFDTTQPVNYAVSNIISSIVYGSRFEYSDPRFKQMVNRANESVRIGGSAPLRLYNIFPWIGPFLRSKRKLDTNFEDNMKEIKELIRALQKTLTPDDRRGFVDSFLLRKQSDEQSGQKNSLFNEKNLLLSVINLFVAGTDTTGTTLRWGLLLMAKYPHIQDRVQEEIDRVIGGRQAVVEDRKNLPYTDAVIHEIQRLANIVPLSLPHTTSCDVHFNGFFIKKGTTVYPLLTSVLRDENEWESPHTFNPAHFLDEQGRFVKKDAFLPFSAGRRVCLGESLAKMELFLFFTSLLQHFRFTPPPGVSEDQLDLTGMSKQYGSIFTVYFGPKKVVVLTGYQTIKQALVNHAEEFSGRDISPIFYDVNKGYGEPFDTAQPLTYAASNIISSIVYGSRFEYSDPLFKDMVKRANMTIHLTGSASIQESGAKNILFHEQNLIHTVANLFAAGTDTTATTLRWSLLLMAKYPHVQDRVQEEIDRVIADRQPVMGDKKNLPYTDAVIHEIQRLANIAPLCLPHTTTCDVRFQGFVIKKMSKKYGSVFTVYFGPKKAVILAGYQTVKQALVNHSEEFGDRDISPLFYDFNEGYGILFSNGENWKEMRRFALATLRDFGMGKKGVEVKIIEETRYLREVFEQFKGKPFDTTQPVNYAISNIISAIVYGSRFEYSDPLFKEMVNRANNDIKLAGSASIQLYNMFPWLGLCLKNWKLLMKSLEQDLKQVKKLVSGLQETLNPQDCRGLVDCFLVRKQNAEKCGEKNNLFHEKNLLFTITNLFAAGTDTTATTLRWGLLLMAKYPHVQDLVQEEIDRVIGSRQPVVEDRKNLPYTDAVIHETHRLANIVPMSLPHTTTCDVHFQGFFIKKTLVVVPFFQNIRFDHEMVQCRCQYHGTCVFPLLTSVLRDENEWETPKTFNPAHFLDEEGRFVKRDAFMPFSAGRRVCLGEGLARMELFLFFTSLLQHFRFTPPPGVSEDQLDLTPAVGFTLNPSPHKLCAISRNA
ncbi:hypothetical protein NFI96_015680 [Prochilodus magdalenae]|nr:hypothetical protein NFI96_015680 [Prochilodus magdalenae]